MEANPKSRKRKFLNIEDKVDVIKQIENGRKKCEVGKQYGLVSSTIQSIWKNRQNILQTFEQRGSIINMKGKRLCKPDQRDIDRALLEWFYQQRNMNFLVSGPTLRIKAEEFAKNMNFKEFVCTKSWLDRFKVRHKISLYGKANGEGSGGESSQPIADDNDEPNHTDNHNDDNAGSRSVDCGNESINQVNLPEVKVPVEKSHEHQEEDTEEEVVEKESEVKVETAKGINLNSSDTEDSADTVQIETQPTIDSAMQAFRTLKRYYGSSENEQLVGALKIIEDDLEQSYWEVLRKLIMQLSQNEATTNGNQSSNENG